MRSLAPLLAAVCAAAAGPFEQRDLAATHPDDLRRMMRARVAALEAHNALDPLDDDKKTRRKPKLPP